MSNLVPCKDCGHQVSIAAITCPSCGVPKPGQKTDEAGSFWLWACVLVGVLVLGFTAIINKEPSPMQAQKAADTLEAQLEAETKTSVLHPLLEPSDDFKTYQGAFIVAARQLIQSGRCTTKDFKEMGGWLKSTDFKDAPMYFTYCGGLQPFNKVYLNAKTGKIS